MAPSADTMRDLVVVSRVRNNQVEVADVKDGGDVGTGHWQQEVTGDDDINNNNGDVNRQIKESDKDPTAKGDHERAEKSEQVNTLRTRTVLPRPLTFWYLKNENTQQ